VPKRRAGRNIQSQNKEGGGRDETEPVDRGRVDADPEKEKFEFEFWLLG